MQDELRFVLRGLRASRDIEWSDILRNIDPNAKTKAQHGLWRFEKGDNVRDIDAVVRAYSKAAGVEPAAVWATALSRWLAHLGDAPPEQIAEVMSRVETDFLALPDLLLPATSDESG